MRHFISKRSHVLNLAVVGLVAWSATARAAVLYSATDVSTGLSAEFTSSTGYQEAFAMNGNSSGQIIISAQRYSGTTTQGTGLLLYTPGSSGLVRLGLTGAEYTSSSGAQSSSPDGVHAIDNAGRVYGTSTVFTSGVNAATWVYVPGTGNVRVGIYGAGYIAPGFATSSNIFKGHNANGLTIGQSKNYYGTNKTGFTSWVYNPGTNTQTTLGFDTGDYLGANGIRLSNVTGITDSGLVAGHSTQFVSGGTAAGNSTSWIYNTGSSSYTTLPGLTGTVFSKSDSTRSSTTVAMNNSGYVLGSSLRYGAGGSDLGNTYWLYNPNTQTTMTLGPSDAGYTAPNGKQQMSFGYINNAGQVAGTNNRFNASSTSVGIEAWLYTPGAGYKRAGLTGAAYTGSDGRQLSTVTYLAQTGHVFGGSIRYSGTTNIGSSIYAYDPSTDQSYVVGLEDSRHLSSSGSATTTPFIYDESGRVLGFSQRFTDNGLDAGQSGWYFDPTDNTTSPLIFSERPADHYAYTLPIGLTPNGGVVGQYNEYDQTNGSLLGTRAFFWSKNDGLITLDNVTDMNEFTRLSIAVGFNGLSQIYGGGATVDGNLHAVVLTPVPEPAALATLAGGLGALALRRRR